MQRDTLPVPTCPLEPVGNNIRVIVMILPGADEVGALEELCLKAVDQDPAMMCVEKYFKCLENIRNFSTLQYFYGKSSFF